MAQEKLETTVRQDVAPGMAEHLSQLLGRKISVDEIKKEGLEALKSLSEGGTCPVCQAGEVKYVPAVSCGIEFRCSYDTCSEFYTRREVGFPGEQRDPILDEGTSFETGYKILIGRHRLEERQALK